MYTLLDRQLAGCWLVSSTETEPTLAQTCACGGALPFERGSDIEHAHRKETLNNPSTHSNVTEQITKNQMQYLRRKVSNCESETSIGDENYN